MVIFPDVELWATDYLRTALASRSEEYADAKVSNAVPTTMPARLVAVRRDGGPELDVARELARLGVNIYAPTEQEATDLARLVRALLKAAPDGKPVCKVTTTGPSPIPDRSGKPHRYFTVELIVRGADLT